MNPLTPTPDPTQAAQQQQMTTASFAAAVRKKYPTGTSASGQAYSAIPDQQLVQQIVQKYPVYQNQISDYQAAAPATPATPVAPSFSGTATAIGSDFDKRADTVGQIENSTDNPASKTLQVLGQGAGAVNDAAGEVIKSAIKPEVLASIGTHLAPLVQAASQSEAGQAVLKWWEGLNPETQKNLSASGSIASLLSNAVGAGAGKEVATGGIDLGINSAAKDAVAPIADAAAGAKDAVVNTTKKVAGATKEAVKPSLSPEEAVGQVVQGKTEDVAAAHRTLSTIDTKGVKTYADLQGKINAEIKPLAQKVDAELGKDTATKTTPEFEQTVGEGEGAVKVNYVQRAIDDLKTFYQKTGDAAGESKIKTLETKANTDGLNAKDVNDLAREHGTAINAFNANGEAASGLTKQAAENTRTGLKGIARQSLGGDAAKALDSKLSDLYDTKALIDKQVEKVNALAQKTGKTGLAQKIVGKTVKGIDAVAGGPLKAIGHAMGTIKTGGEMDAADLEAQLVKNLKTIKRV